MRAALALCILCSLSACASDQYSKVPEATGEWVPANPTYAATVAVPAPPPPGVRMAPRAIRAAWASRKAAP